MGNVRVITVVDRFPATSETFIRRQVRRLRAVVAAPVVERQWLETDDRTVQLSPDNRLRNGRLVRGWNRLQRCAGIDPSLRWPSSIESAFHGLLRRDRPDVILAQFGPNGIRCLTACREESIPLVVHFHGYDASAMLRNRAYCRRLGDLFHFASASVAVSTQMRDNLINLDCPGDRLHVIPYGVPVDSFTVAANRARQPCRFVAVGRFVEKKAPLLLLRAFAICASACEGVCLDCVGDGPLLPRARRWLSHQGDLARRVRLLGAQPHPFVYERLQQAGCFVQHSVTAANGDTEGWPVAIAEAAAAGLPVIATSHAGIPEQVIDGKTGFLVAERDVDAMSRRMIEIAGDGQARERMGDAARRHITEVGDFDRQIGRLNDVLCRAAGKVVQKS